MSWPAIALGALAVLIALSVALPTWRRIWAFNLRTLKYLVLWLLDVCRVRELWLRLTGQRYVRLTRPRMLRRFCEDMGPTFIKFGQIVASSAGIFPDRYVVEFQKCLDRVRPFSFRDVQAIIAADLDAEQAALITDIDPQPLASASIAQVHTATLRPSASASGEPGDGDRDRGEPVPVVVKVQRPGIAGLVAADMRIMRVIARIVARVVPDAELSNPVGIVDDFAATLREELDFCLESQKFAAVQPHHGRTRPHHHPCADSLLAGHQSPGSWSWSDSLAPAWITPTNCARAASTPKPSWWPDCGRGFSAWCFTASFTATSTPAT